MSLNEINRELETLLEQIKRLKKEEQLGEVLDRVEELRSQAQDPTNPARVVANVNKTQDVRTFEDFTAVYKAVKLRADTLRDAGKMHHVIDTPDSIETRVMDAYEVFQSNIEPKKLAMLEEFKDRYTEAELARVKQEDADSYASKIEHNEREMEEANSFLQMISKDEVERYKTNADILQAINQMNLANRKIQEAQNTLASLTSPEDDAEIANQNQIIADQKVKIAEAQSKLNACKVIEAPQIIDADGNIQSSIIEDITATYKQAAMQDKKEAGENILQNLERHVNNNGDSLQEIRRIEKYIGKIPEDFDNVKPKELEDIVTHLLAVGKNIDRKSTQNHKMQTKIDEINAFLGKLEKEKNIAEGKAKTDNTGTARYGFKTPKQYREEGIVLDETYALKDFWERRKDREEYILETLPANAPFRKMRAWIRSFSPRAGYALSEAKQVRETQMRRKEEAFQAALKQKGMTTEDARVVGMKEVRIDKLSGKRKAQMEERE